MQKLWVKLKLLIIALDQYYLDCSVTPIESSEQSDEHEHVLEKDDSEAPKRSKRQSFGDDFTLYLVDNTHTSIA